MRTVSDCWLWISNSCPHSEGSCEECQEHHPAVQCRNCGEVIQEEDQVGTRFCSESCAVDFFS
jgi:hypothetical protein